MVCHTSGVLCKVAPCSGVGHADIRLHRLAPAPHHPRLLTRRSMSGNRELKDEGCASLAAGLEANTALVELDLGQCGIGPSGGAALGQALRANSSLQTLRCAPPLSAPVVGEIGRGALRWYCKPLLYLVY